MKKITSTVRPEYRDLPPLMHQPRQPHYWEDWQKPDGSEIVSPVSLVAEVDLYPLSMSEQLERFMRAPDYDGYDDGEDLPDEVLEGDDIMTPHEDRFRETTAQLKRKQKEKVAVKEKERVEAEKAELERMSKRLDELRKKGAEIPAPASTQTEKGE